MRQGVVRVVDVQAQRRGTAGRDLAAAVAVLIVVDVVGGVLAVAHDENTWTQAWSSEAVLAAPWPMMAAQVLLTAVAVRRHDRAAAVAAGLLATACLVSAVSGFFDGQLGREGLSAGLVAFQWLLVGVTAGTGLLALRRLREVLR